MMNDDLKDRFTCGLVQTVIALFLGLGLYKYDAPAWAWCIAIAMSIFSDSLHKHLFSVERKVNDLWRKP